jgi:hypothetical protein
MTITDKQRADWQALVDYCRDKNYRATYFSLVEDGPDDKTDFAGLLTKFRSQDAREGK